MAALRKMLGSVQEEGVVALMRLMETQSKQTLAKWAAGYAEEHYLPILKKRGLEDARLTDAAAAVKKCLQGELPIKEGRKIFAEARKAGQEITEHPAAQAAARAIATACAVLLTPTNALGFVFYGAAAYAYEEAGLKETPGAYDKLASEEIGRILASLQAAAVPDEENPAKLEWNC